MVHFKLQRATGKKNYSSEKVLTYTEIEGKPWDAYLYIFCDGGSLTFALRQYRSPSHEPVRLDRDGSSGLASLRIKFDNKEPFFTPWLASEVDPGSVSIYDNLVPIPETDDNRWNQAIKLRQETIKRRKRIIEGMIKYRRLWIGFEVNYIPYIAKFDLTGFSRELAKCSKIPDTN